MNIVRTTSDAAIAAFTEKACAIMGECITSAFKDLARECERRIRERGGDESWYDRTGNLRSSTGAAVYDHGKTVMRTAFSSVLGGNEGSAAGRRMVEELASEYSRVFALAAVAAMDYAGEVEALESKDVLESARLWAERAVEGRLKAAMEQAAREIEKLVL